MFSIQQPLLVFSDLDGTLLDSHSYDWQPAARSAVYTKPIFPSFSVAVKLQRKCCTCKNVGATRLTADCREWRSDPAC